MNEELLKSLPIDPHAENFDGKFRGRAYVYNSESGIEEINFYFQPEKPLDPFYYNKPNSEIPPVFTRDEEPRENVFPVAIARDSRRRPNHLYESDDAVIAVVNSGTKIVPKWETRYFPKKCIDEATWKQALEILRIKE